MKIYTNKANENWVCDRFAEEWEKNNPNISTSDINSADIIWIMAGWVWRAIPSNILKSKKVIVTQHHIDEIKFDRAEFNFRDMYVDCYHVTNEITGDFLSKITNKPIHTIPFWANPDLWFNLEKKECRKELGLPIDKYLIGSFQRDTEGFDLKTPKLSKGPDIFCDMVEKFYESNNNIEVVLGGWRRQYIMNRLDTAGIKYHYFKLPPFEVINKLYNSLDLYIVASRVEGGPQALVECALSKTPIISSNVGISDLILPEESIFDLGQITAVSNTKVAYEKVQKFVMKKWFNEFSNLFEGLL